MTPVCPYRYSRPIYKTTIYIDGSSYPRASYWQPRIVEAVNNWMYTGYGDNEFSATYVSSNVGSYMDFHSQYQVYFEETGDPEALAVTELYNNQGAKYDNCNEGNWYYVKIIINEDKFRRDSFSNAEAVRTLIHEMGHAFGLKHDITNPYSIMYPNNQGIKVFKVQLVDHNAMNWLYSPEIIMSEREKE